MSARVQATAVALLFAAASFPTPARAWHRGRARVFATLPAGAAGPEGLEVDRAGRVYVATYGFTSSGAASGPGQLYVFDRDGELLRQVSVAGSSPNLLGLRFHPQTGALLVADAGKAQVLAVDPHTGASTVFMTLPALPTPALGSSLNDIAFDHAANVYVSDSFQGLVWRVGPGGGTASIFVESALLRTSGVPPFGANGLRFNHAETALFVANTGDDTIVEVPISATGAGLVAGAPAVFTNSINGADGVIIDADDNLWVVANQSDEVVVVDRTGKAIAKLGDFGGAVEDGRPVQLLFPASLRFHGDELLVTNLSLDLRLFKASYATVDSEWCAQVSRYTVSRIRLHELRGSGSGERDDRD